MWKAQPPNSADPLGGFGGMQGRQMCQPLVLIGASSHSAVTEPVSSSRALGGRGSSMTDRGEGREMAASFSWPWVSPWSPEYVESLRFRDPFSHFYE